MIPMIDVEWKAARMFDNSLNLFEVFKAATAEEPSPEQAQFLEDIMKVRPIVSRQVAALAVAMAVRIK